MNKLVLLSTVAAFSLVSGLASAADAVKTDAKTVVKTDEKKIEASVNASAPASNVEAVKVDAKAETVKTVTPTTPKTAEKK